MVKIFVSYRRGDSAGTTGRLYDRLCQALGKDCVFMDVDGIDPGVDFVDALTEKVTASSAMLVVMGPDWMGGDPNRGYRIADEHDFVRIEVGEALAKGLRVIPVLVDGASMPSAEALPSEIKPLLRRNAVTLRHDRFGSDAEFLIDALQKVPAPTTAQQVESEDLIALLRRFVGPAFFVAPDVPASKEQAARVRNAVPAELKVLALVDITVFENAKNSILFCQDRVFYHCDINADIKDYVIRYAELKDADIHLRGSHVFVGDKKFFINGNGNYERVVNALTAIKQRLL